MPRYDFRCSVCAALTEAVAGIEERARPCAECGGPAERCFAVCRNIQTPRHFQLSRGWHLPKTPAEIAHAEKMAEKVDGMRAAKAKPFRKFVEEKLQQDRKITLSS